MDYEKLDTRIVKSWRIARVITLGIFAFIFGIALFILWRADVIAALWYYVVPPMAIILLYRAIAIIVYPMIEYRQWRYLITEDKVEIRFGIFFITTTIIPIVRIQHITLSSGPINRKLGLSTVQIHTASGTSDIQGLSNEAAEKISENLKAKLISRLQAEV